MNYKEKRTARIERLKYAAKKAEKKSDEFDKQGEQIRRAIPFGQPILVGHHSERGHRSSLKRMHNFDNKCVEEYDKAKEYERKAKAAEKNTAIYSDDPEAIKLLKQNIAGIEKIKEKNSKKKGVERFVMTNLNTRLRSAKKRLVELEAHRNDKTTELTIGGIKIIDNVEDNRVQIFFDGKPEESVRRDLKYNGFRWTPSKGCWQRHRSSTAIIKANNILNSIDKKKDM